MWGLGQAARGSQRSAGRPRPSAWLVRVMASGFFEHGEGAVDLAGLLVAAEEVAYLAAVDSVGSVFGERPDLISGGVADAVAKDPSGGVEAVTPDGECGFEVRWGDLLGAVERGVDRGEADNVRGGAAGGGAQQSFLAVRERSVDLDPARCRQVEDVGRSGRSSLSARTASWTTLKLT